MKNFSAFLLFSLFLPIIVVAQKTSEYTLYLKNGSIIKCSLINYDPAKSITVQTFDGQKFDFKVEEIDSLVLAPETSPKQPTPQSPARFAGRSRYSDAGFSIGAFIPFGSFSGGASRTGIAVAGRLSNGINPGLFMTLGYCHNGNSGNEGNQNVLYAVLGSRFGVVDSVSGKGFSFAPVIGATLSQSTSWCVGVMADVHIQRNILITIQCIASEISLVQFSVSFVLR